MATFPIPQRTLPVGASTVGPADTGKFTSATISLDRTLAGGMNSLDPAEMLTLAVQSSPGGATWNDEAAADFPCGTYTHPRTGLTYTATTLTVNGVDPQATQVRVVATVSGPSPIAVSGSITAT